ncbi:4'-phosphopantetheinyl transferase superfamily protein [Lentzea sp. CC55]|uniref:4'-phosphopantetheinyl transferase superfamily protein n=1 Tax=Lentzea sp. CC55 TaxID=2884909 RepID=UPI0027DFD9E8|nr:4'-phosphopantetheinyl transferase superfamily protein [Lentzea sp. CC55]MCG8926916.1 4'-phosphopantetheinyl transferase superfamily protein [Lentzea sp. CC55]
MTAPPMLFGVDVVDVARVTRAMSYSGPAYTRHVASPAERDLHADPGLATAAAVAVKECLVKAIGGRPRGFSWHDFEACGEVPLPGAEWADPLLAAAVPEVEAATRVSMTERCVYSVLGASGSAALARLTERSAAPGDSATVVGMARWGFRGDLIVALAILITMPRGALRCP